MVQYPRYPGQFNYSPHAPIGYVPAIYPNASTRQPRMGTRARASSVMTPVPTSYPNGYGISIPQN